MNRPDYYTGCGTSTIIADVYDKYLHHMDSSPNFMVEVCRREGIEISRKEAIKWAKSIAPGAKWLSGWAKKD